jgi:hypothetical protein
MRDRRADRAGRTRPAVVVLHQPCPDDRCRLREISAGMEEEGVPFSVEEAEIGSAVELAHAAAQASMLDVGVGVDAAGTPACTTRSFRRMPLPWPAPRGWLGAWATTRPGWSPESHSKVSQ